MTSRRRALAAVVGLAVAGQLIALAYELAAAGRFGTRADADALALALAVVLALGSEIVTWITTLFVPRFVHARARGGAAAARALGARWLAVVAGATVLGAGVLALAAPALVALLTPPGAVRAEATSLVRLAAPLVALLPVAVLLAGVLQGQGRFALAGLRQLCWYGGALLALLGLGGWLGVAAVPAGMTLGLAAFCGVLVLAIARARDSGEPGPVAGGAAAPPPLGAVLLPLVLASAVNYVNVSLERALAARLPEGSLAAFTYAGRLLNLPVTLVLLNATTILLPGLAAHAARDEREAVAALVLRAVRLALIAAVPLAALALTLADPLVAVLLERGAFTAESTRLTATALAFSAPGLAGIAGMQVLARAYHALHQIRRLAAIGIAAAIANVALMLSLTPAFGLRGLAAAAAITPLLLFAWMLAGLRPWLPTLDVGAVAASAGRAVLAGGAAIACVAALPAAPPLVALLAGGMVGVAVYALVLAALSRDDARLALAVVAPRSRGLAPRGGR